MTWIDVGLINTHTTETRFNEFKFSRLKLAFFYYSGLLSH
jgi:hypothetical protein